MKIIPKIKDEIQTKIQKCSEFVKRNKVTLANSKALLPQMMEQNKKKIKECLSSHIKRLQLMISDYKHSCET